MTTQHATVQSTGRIPWQTQYDLGSGITAFSAELNASALKKVTTAAKPGGYHTEDALFSITSSEEIEKRLAASISGSFNAYGIEISGSASYLRQVKTDSKTLCYVLQYKTYRDVNVGGSKAFKFNKAASKLVKAKNWPRFRSEYGDFYISGYREEAIFSAVFRLTAENSDELTKFKASFSASKPDMFTAKGSGSFKALCKTHKISISIRIIEQGTSNPGDIPTGDIGDPDKIVDAFKRFKKELKLIRTAALLTHYSILVPDFPKTIPGDPEAVAAVAKLYADVLYGNGKADDLPGSWAPKLQKELDDLYRKLQINGGSLYKEATRRKELQKDIDAWFKKVQTVLNYQTFSREVSTLWNMGQKAVVEGLRDKKDTYPNNDGSSPTGPVTYGLSASDLEGVEVQSLSKYTGHVPSDAPGWSRAILNFDMSGNTIVGFTANPTWRDGTDGYWCLDSGGIGEQTGRFAFRSHYDRGLDYSITVYTIPADYYNV